MRLLLVLLLLVGGCFQPPTKEDVKEVTRVTAEALGKGAVEQLATEVKRVVTEHTSENKDPHRDSETPVWAAIAVYVINEIRKVRRDGFMRRSTTNS